MSFENFSSELNPSREVKAMSVTVKNTRKPYITSKEREQQHRQIFKKFCFELLLKQDEKGKIKGK